MKILLDMNGSVVKKRSGTAGVTVRLQGAWLQSQF